MSDSESDLLPNNILTFQTHGTTVCAKGPNINSTNISSLSFRNNMTSSMSIPWNQDRPRYAGSVYDQRSVSYRREREISPMSFHSASGMQPRNFQNSYYTSRMSSHRSMYNGRSGSPGSVRTIDSNTSLSARDIAFAIKTGNFNKFDFEIIKDAYNKFLKGRLRKRVEKKRNLRMFLKGFRRQSGGDSGDQASDSSISSDDCRSTRTSKSTIYKENMSSCRSTRTDLSDFRRTVKECNMLRDCTENFRHNSFKNMFGVGSANVRDDSRYKLQNSSVVSQKDRFKTGLLLPSQRFNQSVASLPIPENPEKVQQSQKNKCMNMKTKIISQNSNTDQRRSNETESEQEEIFPNVTIMERSSYNNNGKRGLDDDAFASDKKRAKLSTPQKTNFKPKTPNQKVTDPMFKQRPNDFIFAKPQFPVRKTNLVKTQQKIVKSSQPKEKSKSKSSIQPEEVIITKSLQASVKEPIMKSQELPREKLISSSLKSAEKMVSKTPLVVEKAPMEKLISKCLQTLDVQQTLEAKSPQNMVVNKEPCSQPETTLSITNMSMRPSFIKRKLFTQKVDEAEKNSSSDSLQVDSPQTNIYSKIQKEKNKARKLVTTQSCLNRDVLGDDNNLLDLIHKLVPVEQMNATTATNRSVVQNNKSKPANSDKWDVTTMLSTYNNDTVSDTYTDEEIFNDDKTESQQQSKVNQKKCDGSRNNTQEHIKPNQKKPEEIKNTKQKDVAVKQHQKNVEVKKQITTYSKKKEEEKQTTDKSQNRQKSMSPKSWVVLKKLKTPVASIAGDNDHTSPSEKDGLIKNTMYNYVKSFWDTDVESDIEFMPLRKSDPRTKGTTIINATDSITNYISNGEAPKTTKASAKSTLTTTLTSKKEQNSNIKSKPIVTLTTKQNNVTEQHLSKTTHKLLNTSFKTKKKDMTSQKSCANVVPKKNNITLNNNKSLHTQVHNNSLRIRTHRKPKINKCCEPDKLEQSVDSSTDTHYRSLRSRQVDLSTSLKSNEDNQKNNIHTMLAIKAVGKNKRGPIKNKKQGENTLPSDISFTLIDKSPTSKQITNIKKVTNSKTHKDTSQSDVSFTLVSDKKSLDNTVLTRGSLKRNREVELLRLNTSLLSNSGKRSPQYRKTASLSVALNRTRNTSRICKMKSRN